MMLSKIIDVFTKIPAKVALSTVYGKDKYRAEFPCFVRIGDTSIMISFFRLADDHFASVSQLMYCVSDDFGRNWTKPVVLSQLIASETNSSWNCPSCVVLKDETILLCCEESVKDLGNIRDERLFKVNQHFWRFSFKNNRLEILDKWSVNYFNVFGFNQDRVLVLPNGHWMMGWHFYGNKIVIDGKAISENPNLIQCVSFSEDEGKSWGNHRVVTDQPGANLCDGNMVFINSTRIGCFMRDHSFNGAPSYVSFSDDFGQTWTLPQALPFSGHHNITKRVTDNIFFSFYRNVSMRDGTINKADIGVWGAFFRIDDLSRCFSFEIENDGTMWQNCGWGDVELINPSTLFCQYYLTGERDYPVIRQAKVNFNINKIKSILGR